MRIVMFAVHMPDQCGAFFHDVIAAKHLIAHGHQVMFVFMKRVSTQGLTGYYRGIPYKYYMMAEGDLQSSDVWTTPHYPIVPNVRKLNERFQKPLVITAHFAENIESLKPYQQGGKWAEAVFYVSNHMKRTIESRIQLSPTIRRSEVLYPIVKEQDIALPDTREPGTYITLVNGNLLKGVDVFLRVADRMKEHSFMGVRAYYRHVQVHNTENVKWENYSDDVRPILAKTRILMVPSMTESWSRIAFEAMYNGIPVLYTRPYDQPSFPGGTTHAMEEWIGDSAIACDRTNIDEWVEAIRMLDDPVVYNEWSARARTKARSLNLYQNADKYETFLKSFIREFPSVNGVTKETSGRQGPGQQQVRPATVPNSMLMAGAAPGGRAGFAGGRFSIRR